MLAARPSTSRVTRSQPRTHSRYQNSRPYSRMSATRAHRAEIPGDRWANHYLPSGNFAASLVIDSSWFLPAAKRNPGQEFVASRIAGSLCHFDIDKLSDKSSPLPHMLPTVNQFEQQVSELGLSNGDQIVAYDSSGFFFASARVWWTFRVFGHDNISVLDGGLAKWKQLGYPTESGPVAPAAKGKFVVQELRRKLLRTMPQVVENIKFKEFQLVDARAAGRFKAVDPEPRAGLVGGHVPGSFNVDFKAVVDASTGQMKNSQALKQVFQEAGVNVTQPISTTCGSGVSASVLALALHQVGNTQAAVYDGSWSEYGQADLQNPVAK